MIFSEILNTYFGWCPRYNVNTSQTTSNPLTYLSIIGKVTILTLLGAWGIYNLYINQIFIPSYLDQVRLLLSLGIVDPQLVAYLFIFITKAASGAILIVLLADFIASRRIQRRHRIELSALLITQAIYWLLTPIGLTDIFTDWGMYALDWWYSLGLLGLLQAFFLLYMAYRLLSNRNVLGRNTFMLLSVVLVASLVFPFVLAFRPDISATTQHIVIDWDWRYLMELGVNGFVYLVAAIFCFRVYRDLRKVSSFELSLPTYIRGIIVLWSLSSLDVAHVILYGNVSHLLLLNFASILNVFYIGLIVASFLPLRFRVGENPPVSEATP